MPTSILLQSTIELHPSTINARYIAVMKVKVELFIFVSIACQDVTVLIVYVTDIFCKFVQLNLLVHCNGSFNITFMALIKVGVREDPTTELVLGLEINRTRLKGILSHLIDLYNGQTNFDLRLIAFDLSTPKLLFTDVLSPQYSIVINI